MLLTYIEWEKYVEVRVLQKKKKKEIVEGVANKELVEHFVFNYYMQQHTFYILSSLLV